MAQQDYYQELGVAKTASQDEIRKAYRKLAKQYHPDSQPDDASAAEKFKRVQQAYSVLGDVEKRKKYDQLGPDFEKFAAGNAGPGAGGSYRWGGGGSPQGGPIDLEDILGGQFGFEDLFGGGAGGGRQRRGPRPRAGADVKSTVKVPFETAVRGGSIDIQLDRSGRPEAFSVKIPPGVDNGKTIRLAQQGHPGSGGGRPGDLLLTINVQPHPYFRREGNNLLLDVPLSVTEAALGAKVEVPTLTEGSVMLTIPPGTSGGAKLRLRGKGVTLPKGEAGDQLIVVKIVVPKLLSGRAEELFKELDQELQMQPRSNLWPGI